MIRTIETHPRGAIQKITTPKGAVKYQVVLDSVAGDTANVIPQPTLAAARATLDVTIKHPERLTTPKAECPHNRPGYKAANAGSSATKAKGKVK